MSRFVRRNTLAALVAAIAAWGIAPGAWAQDAGGNYRDAHRLGGATTRFYSPTLTNAASLKRYANNKRVVSELAIVLKQAGVPDDVASKVVPTLQNPTDVVKGASCTEATPADGTIVDCTFPVGGTMDWMATRPRVRGKRTATILRNLRWAGRRPFGAFLFRVTTEDRLYIFMVPKPCGNLTLVRTEDIKKTPVDVTVDRSCAPDGTLTATVRATGDLSKVGSVRVSINGSPAGELTGPSWSMTTNKPGTYSFEATDKTGKSYPVARASITVDPCPPPPPPQVVNPTCRVNVTSAPVKGGYELTIDATGSGTGTAQATPTVNVEVYGPTGAMVGQRLTLDNSLTGKVTVPKKPAGAYRVRAVVATPQPVTAGNMRYEGEATCEASVTPAPPATAFGPSFFVDGAFGKERRERPVSELSAVPAGLPADATFGQCSPMLGLKAGVAKRFSNDWEVAGDVGVGLMFVDTNEKVRKNPLFIDVEANKYLANGMFLGTGISLWDLTRSDTFTPAWLVHFGVPLNKGARIPVYFLGEGRLFFDNIDSVDNNYQFWGGVRVQFPINK
jgi:hypothetical protein